MNVITHRLALKTLPWVAALSAGAALAAPHTFQVTREAPGVQQANVASLCASLGPGTCTIGVENFDSRSSGSFTTDFGITSGYTVTGTYSDAVIMSHDVWGGAGGAGNYAVTFVTGGFAVDLATTNPDGINYFGYWLSALDRGNQVQFYSNGELVFSFAPTDVDATIGGSCPGNSAYCGNPNAGGNPSQPYVFLNFFDKTGTFDRIVFSENPQIGGYESDNHTVGYVTGGSGTPVNGVPVPGTLLLSGMGLVGLGLFGSKRRATRS